MVRSDLHLETSYSYLTKNRKFSPKIIINKCEEEKIKAIAIVDYGTCAAIPIFEKLRKNHDLKIIYGLSVNLKFKDLIVPSVILAKNSKGLAAIYKIVLLIKENKEALINFGKIKNDLDNLILGLEKYEKSIDYTQVQKYYSYVEINPFLTKEEVLATNNWAREENLIVIATCKPKNILQYLSYEEMKQKFSYVENIAEILNNNEKIINQIEDYHLDFKTKYYLENNSNESLRQSVYEKANLLYLEEIPNEVTKRIEEELKIIAELNLEGTILLLKKLIKEAKQANFYATVGSYLSHFLICYLEGMIELNPLETMDKYPIANLLKRVCKVEIFASQKGCKFMQNYLQQLLGHPNYYQSVLTFDMQNDIEIKTGLSFISNTFYLIPASFKQEDIRKISPIIAKNKKEGLLFNLEKQFVGLRFRPTIGMDMLELLEKKTKVMRDDLNFQEEGVFSNMIWPVASNEIKDYPSYIHYNMVNLWYNRIILDESKKEQAHNLKELINLHPQVASFLPKVIIAYQLSYYKTYYSETYFKIYLKTIIDYFKLNDLVNSQFRKDFAKNYVQNKAINYFQQEKNPHLALVKVILRERLASQAKEERKKC